MRHSVAVLLGIGIGDGRLTSLNAIGFARHRPTWSTIDRCGVESCLHSSSSSSDSSGSTAEVRRRPRFDQATSTSNFRVRGFGPKRLSSIAAEPSRYRPRLWAGKPDAPVIFTTSDVALSWR